MSSLSTQSVLAIDLPLTSIVAQGSKYYATFNNTKYPGFQGPNAIVSIQPDGSIEGRENNPGAYELFTITSSGFAVFVSDGQHTYWFAIQQ